MTRRPASFARRDLLKTALAAPFVNRLGAAARPPNILVVMTDQQFADAMSCRIGRRYIHTPAMDSLAATGMLFSRAYCPNPICVPSRTSMFSGRYPSETGQQDNVMKPIDPQRFPMMGTIFRRAGYTTAFAGKWHMPYPERDPATHGFDILPRRQKRDDGIAAAAADFLRTNRREPFLLVASLVNPHNICEWARGDALPDGEIGAPPPVDECPPLRPNHQPQKNEPDGLSLMRRSYHNTKMFPVGAFDAKKWREYIWAYYRMTEKVDALIGDVLRPLRESGQEERTVVVFLSDHGDCQGAHRWNQKTVFLDEAARVPLIVSHKGVTRPGVSDRLVQTGVDLIPTLCGYAGIPTPEGLPGLSLKETAGGKGGKDSRECVVVSNRMAQGGPVDGRVPELEGRMVRSRRYKYCAYSEGRLRESLVDMEKDPGETENLAENRAHREALERHRAMLANFIRQTKDPFRV
jgi:arylsulfatase A-like enzyme